MKTKTKTKMKMIRNMKSGFSFIELIVYMVIFLLLMGLIVGVFPWLRHSDQSMKRLDILHHLRQSSFHLSEQLSYSTGLIFPTTESGGADAHQVVFKTARNEIMVIFLNEKGRLIMLNWTKKCAGKSDFSTVLTNDTLQFNVKRPQKDYLEYSVKIQEYKKDGLKGKDFSLANSVRLRNIIK